MHTDVHVHLSDIVVNCKKKNEVKYTYIDYERKKRFVKANNSKNDDGTERWSSYKLLLKHPVYIIYNINSQ